MDKPGNVITIDHFPHGFIIVILFAKFDDAFNARKKNNTKAKKEQ